MNTYLRLKDGDMVCLHGYVHDTVITYPLSQRKLSWDDREYTSYPDSFVVQSDTDLSVLEK